MNRYRAVNDAGVARFGEVEFEAEFTVAEELDWLNAGVLVLVPRPYRVLSDRFTIEGWPCPKDAVVHAGYPIEIEAALINAGHLQRDDPAPKARRRRTPTNTEE